MSKSKEVLQMIDDLTLQIKDIKSKPGQWWEKLDKIVTITVSSVELGFEEWKGEDKKALAEAVILDLWFKNFNSKFIPDFIERPVAKKLISYIVDKAIEATVALFNRKGVFKHA